MEDKQGLNVTVIICFIMVFIVYSTHILKSLVVTVMCFALDFFE